MAASAGTVEMWYRVRRLGRGPDFVMGGWRALYEAGINAEKLLGVTINNLSFPVLLLQEESKVYLC